VSIEIANEAGADVDTDSVLAVARHALNQMGVNPLAELSVLLVDVEYMTELNHRWMGGDGPTDVLAFPMDEGTVDHGPGEPAGGEPALLGDIVLCPEVAAKQAATAGHSTADELHLLTVHGCLHLLGYDHAEPEEEREMFGLQTRLLKSWRGGAASAAVTPRGGHPGAPPGGPSGTPPGGGATGPATDERRP
jgi:probable rRNA maturation factor